MRQYHTVLTTVVPIYQSNPHNLNMRLYDNNLCHVLQLILVKELTLNSGILFLKATEAVQDQPIFVSWETNFRCTNFDLEIGPKKVLSAVRRQQSMKHRVGFKHSCSEGPES